MNKHSDPATNGALHARISELEEQLAAAGSENRTQTAAESSMRQTLAYAESIIDTVREPMLVLDSALHVKTASRAFCQTFGTSRGETEGLLVYDLGNGQWNIPALRTLLEEVLPEQKSFMDFEVIHDFPTLGRRVMLLNARKLWREGNNTELILLAIEDVTERKRIADELVQSNEDMQRFAYVAAHDLRAPVNAALRMCKLAARRLQDTGGKDEADLLSEAVENLERLRILMRDILSYSEMGNAPQRRAMMPLQEPLKIALLNLEHHIKENGAEIEVGDLPSVPADRTQMVMVFQNLIGNALKYRGKEPPRIRIGAVYDGTDWLISVSDNGQGFKREYAATVFEPFKRLHGPDVPGSGIGFATCKRVIERLGGRIWPEAEPGEGSTFFFTLPAEGPSSIP